VQAVYNPIPKK